MLSGFSGTSAFLKKKKKVSLSYAAREQLLVYICYMISEKEHSVSFINTFKKKK